MGMFSFLDKPFRTGATKAAREAKESGQVTLADQTALRNEIGGIYQPRMDMGNQAFNDLNSFYSGDQQSIIDQAQASPFMSSLISQGEQAIGRNAQATGGFRSGTTQENLAGNSQNVLMGLVNQMLEGKQNIAQAGYGATDSYTNAMQNIIAGQGNTRGQIANVGINQAAQKGNMLGGLLQAGAMVGGAMMTGGASAAAGGGAVGGAAGAGASAGGLAGAFSDKALKSEVVQIGTKNDLPWYSWRWNEKGNDLGLSGYDQGHIAQEVQAVRPELVTTKNGYLTVNYGGF